MDSRGAWCKEPTTNQENRDRIATAGEAEDGFTTELGSDGIATAGGGRGRIRDGARSQSTAGKAEDRLATELGASTHLENSRNPPPLAESMLSTACR